MARNILILGASYGSLLATKLLMAGHNVTLVCRKQTAELINRDGTEVRIKLRDEAAHRPIFSHDLPGILDAVEPADVDPSRYDLVGLAMQEPQYTDQEIQILMIKIAEAKLPCLSIMNMPPLPYLKRIPALAKMELEEAYTNAAVWERFEPGLMSLCSPDPQAFRPPEEAANVLHVGLPTNFKAASFADEKHNLLLRELEADIDAERTILQPLQIFQRTARRKHSQSHSVTSQNHAIFLGIGLEEAAFRTAGEDQGGRRSRFQKQENRQERCHTDQQDRSERSDAPQPKSFRKQIQEPAKIVFLHHSSGSITTDPPRRQL